LGNKALDKAHFHKEKKSGYFITKQALPNADLQQSFIHIWIAGVQRLFFITKRSK